MSEKCDYCDISFDRPSIGCENEAKHKTPDIVDRIVHDIESDITDRRGIGSEFESIESELQQEIRESWGSIIKKHLQ
jgi:hypothetical protein